MNIRIYFCFIILYSGQILHAQNSFEYTYDAAGNRISRTVSVGGGTQKSLSIYDSSTGKVRDEDYSSFARTPLMRTGFAGIRRNLNFIKKKE